MVGDFLEEQQRGELYREIQLCSDSLCSHIEPSTCHKCMKKCFYDGKGTKHKELEREIEQHKTLKCEMPVNQSKFKRLKQQK